MSKVKYPQGSFSCRNAAEREEWKKIDEAFHLEAIELTRRILAWICDSKTVYVGDYRIDGVAEPIDVGTDDATGSRWRIVCYVKGNERRVCSPHQDRFAVCEIKVVEMLNREIYLYADKEGGGA